MAKKKVEVSLDRSPMRDTPLTGDVEITYDGSTIYATSETNQIHLLTENKVCLDDITVDYTKPEPETVTIPVYVYVDGESNEPFAVDSITGIAGASFDDYITTTHGQFENKTVVSATFVDSSYNFSAYFNGKVNINNLNGRLGVICYVPNSREVNDNRILITIE